MWTLIFYTHPHFYRLIDVNASQPDGYGGAGYEITIRQLAELLRELTGFEGELKWDATQPDGNPERSLDVSRAKREFGFLAKTSLADGLRHTIEWYQTYKMLLLRGT
jgi:GDP-L-fucose synthase